MSNLELIIDRLLNVGNNVLIEQNEARYWNSRLCGDKKGVSVMGVLSARLAKVSSPDLSASTVAPIMYSVDGAKFQESMLNSYADVFTAHKRELAPELGRLVTAINNGQMNVNQAILDFHKTMYAIVGY